MSTGPVDRGQNATPSHEPEPRSAREYDGFEDRSRESAPMRDDRAGRTDDRRTDDRRADEIDRRSARDAAPQREAQRQDRAPEPIEEPRSGGRTAGIWLALIFGAIILVLLLIFVIQNNVAATFQYFGAQFDLPLGVAMLLAAIAGALVMALVGSVRMIQMSWTIRKLRKQQERIRQAAR